MLTIFASLLAVASAAPGYGQPPSYSKPPSYGNGPSVQLKNGTVMGSHNSAYNQDYFLGVPYAQPPVNGLRFRNPQSLNSTYNATLQATEYAPSCVGYGGDDIGYPLSEDCLYLNVVRPSGCEDQDLPIGLWIHGGGLVMGGSRDERYNLSFIVENGVKIGRPFIGVSINYRLAGWGFLASEEVMGAGQTNIGLRDQRLALHWIQENIGAFGGDPSKVTIWGESAGAGSVGWHLTAYNGRDDKLFRAGIMESGNPVNYNSYFPVAHYQPGYDDLVNLTGCTNATDTLECLRYAPYDTVNNFFNGSANSDFSPIVDGDFVQRYASIQLAEGDFVKVPVIDGANSDEGTSFGPRGISTDQEFLDYVSNSSAAQAYISKALAPQVLEAYPNIPSYYIPTVEEIGNYTYNASTYGAQYRRTAAYGGDVVMIANRRGTCQTWAANGLNAYCYRFNVRPNGLPLSTGVTHFQEVAFVFDNTMGLGYNAAHGTVNPFGNKPQSYKDLAYLMSSSWASFIASLDPNDWEGRDSKAAAWPAYDNANPQNIVWDANVTELAYAEPDTFRKEGIQFILDHALAYHR